MAPEYYSVNYNYSVINSDRSVLEKESTAMRGPPVRIKAMINSCAEDMRLLKALCSDYKDG